MTAETPPPLVTDTVMRARPRRSLWQRVIGNRFLLVSILVHLFFGLGAAFYVVQRYTGARKLTFTAGPPSPNPSTRALEHKVQLAKKRSTTSAPAFAKRITSVGFSKVTLPEMPAMPTIDQPPTKMAGVGGAGLGLSAGGVGAAGGAPGNSGLTMFGLREVGGGALQGTFYDLKQDKTGKPTEMAVNDNDKEINLGSPQNSAYQRAVGDFILGGMAESLLSRYFSGPSPLYATQIFIPTSGADNGPKAFNLAEKVQPRRWLVVYRGKVIPPQSGNYRFVGFADDVLAVRFRGKIVLEASLANTSKLRPKQSYQYDVIASAFLVGDSFEVVAGSSYPIEIVLGEEPGGEFNAFLFLERLGETYEKNGNGAPILPIFKLAPSDPQGPEFARTIAKDTPWSIWKAEKQSGKSSLLDIFH